MATKHLTYDEMMKLALENYNRGGDGFAECWDERMYAEYIEEFGPMTKNKALKMFRLWKDCTDDIMGY